MESDAAASDHVAGPTYRTLVSIMLTSLALTEYADSFPHAPPSYPPDKGERIRAFHELRYLAARHEVDLFCFADSQESAENKQALQGICRSVYVEVLKRPTRLLRAAGNFFTGQPLSFGFFHSRKFDAKVRQALCERDYDMIFVYCSSMGHVHSIACSRAARGRFCRRRFPKIQAVCRQIRPDSPLAVCSRGTNRRRRRTIAWAHGSTFVCRDRARRKGASRQRSRRIQG